MVSSIQESVARKPAAGADVALPRRPGLLTRMRASRRLMIGATVFVLMVVAAVIGPAVAPHDPLEINSRLTLRTFAPGYLLGTDEFGRDLLSRIIYGARPTLTVAIGATTIALVLGTLFGMVAGYFRGMLDQVIMRTLDTLLSFPPILLAMMVVGFLGPGVRNLVIVIGVLFVPTFARLAYAETLRIKELEYVSAARALGATSPRMLMQHIFPNITAPLIPEHHRAAHCAVQSGDGRGDSARVRAQLPWSRRGAAGVLLGPHDCRRAQLYGPGAELRALAGTGHRCHHSGHQHGR